MGRVFGLEGMGRHASGPLLRLHRDGWLSWRVAKEAPYPLTAARLFPICTEFPAWMRHQKRFGAQKSSRADDMAMRFKYAGIPVNKIKVMKDYEQLIDAATKQQAPVYMMPTYTAMLDIREIFSKNYGFKEFWE